MAQETLFKTKESLSIVFLLLSLLIQMKDKYNIFLGYVHNQLTDFHVTDIVSIPLFFFTLQHEQCVFASH